MGTVHGERVRQAVACLVDGVLGLWRLSTVIIFAAKLVVTVVAGAWSVIIVLQVQTSSDFDQNYQTTLILLITLAILDISSSVLSFHSDGLHLRGRGAETIFVE
jgi:hypothetical protein